MRQWACFVLLFVLMGCEACQKQAAVAPVPAFNPVIRTASFYGLNVHRMPNGPSPFPLEVDAGAIRLWDCDCNWVSLEPQRGKFNWKALDWWVTELHKAQINSVVYVLARPPSWVDQSQLGTGKDQDWRQWVKAVSEYFQKNQIFVTYEVLNEFTYSKNWSGTNQALVQMAQEVNCIVIGHGAITQTKESCADVQKSVGLSAPTSPNSSITSPSFNMGGGWQAYFQTPGALEAADEIAIHIYTQTPQEAIQRTAQIEQAIPGKPIRITEYSWGPQNNQKLTELQKAVWLTTAITAWQHDPRIEQLYEYAYNSSPQTGTGALVTGNGSLTAAGAAYKALAAGIVPTPITSLCPEGLNCLAKNDVGCQIGQWRCIP